MDHVGRRASVMGVVAALLLTCPALPAFAASPLLDSEKQEVIAGIVARMQERYIVPQDIDSITKSLRERAAKGEYRSAVSGEEFAAKLASDLRQVSGDPHFRVDYFPNGIPPLPTSIQPAPLSASEQSARSELDADLFNHGFARAERLEGNVGVLELTSVSSRRRRPR